MRHKLLIAKIGGSYIRGIHQVTMIHIIYTLIDTIFSKVVYTVSNGSGVYVTPFFSKSGVYAISRVHKR